MLLSRVAESVYWAGRYLERAEATARMVKVHTELYLDLPKAMGLGWTPLLAVTGSIDEFVAREGEPVEDDVVRFLLADVGHRGSVLSSLAAVRANMRVTRAVFPRSSWEVLNRLYLGAHEDQLAAVDRRTRLDWTDAVIHQCQMLTGLLAGHMSHDHAYGFLEVGRFIERADMTTRVLDVQAGILCGPAGGDGSPYADVTWMSVLRSLSAHQMYRRTVGRGVSGPDALAFLLKDPQFPRSVEHCLTTISRSLLELPRYDRPMAGCAAVQATLEQADAAQLANDGLHDYVDLLQIGIASLHDELTDTYFRRMPAVPAALAATA